MYESKAYFYGTGRRKHSVSRVRLYPGTGKVTINNRDIDDYFGLDTLKVIVRQPFEVTNTAGQFRPGWRDPSRHRPRSAAERRRDAPNAEKSRPAHPRPKNERA